MSRPEQVGGAPRAARPPAWELSSVSFRYPAAARPAVVGADLTIEAARCTALLGPNGSGKSTLLRLLLGTLRPASGEVRFRGRAVSDWSRGELGRTVGVVPQHEEMTFPITVRELVTMGRYPHLGPLRPLRAADRAAVDDALERCDVAGLAERPVQTLSGGERQRARVARALAQQPQVLVLDEPTLALDIRHEMEIFELIRELAGGGITIVVVTHNLNLAARYADALVLMDEGRVLASGSEREVLDRPLLERVYRWPLERVWYRDAEGHEMPLLVPLSPRKSARRERPK